jgi:hypothetical protein
LVENYHPELKSILDVDAVRKNLLFKLFSKIDLNTDMENVCNVITTCVELCENKIILELVVNDEKILDLLMAVLTQDTKSFDSVLEYNYTETLSMLINILKLVSIENLKVPTLNVQDDIVNSETTRVLESTVLADKLLENLPKILVNFPMTQNDNQIDGTFGMSFHPLGIRRFVICLNDLGFELLILCCVSLTTSRMFQISWTESLWRLNSSSTYL